MTELIIFIQLFAINISFVLHKYLFMLILFIFTTIFSTKIGRNEVTVLERS
jgi:hypothetical protein